VAVAGFVIAGGMGGLWLDSQSTATAEIAELKDTIRSLKRSENQPSSQDSDLIADNAAFQLQISELQKKNTELADENEALKDREAERAQRAIAQSTREAPAGLLRPRLPHRLDIAEFCASKSKWRSVVRQSRES
jgi:hypothetical protein